MAQSLYLPVVLLAAVVGMVVAFAAWLRGGRAGARALTLFLGAASFWAVAEGLSVATGGLGAVRFWTQVALTLSTVIPIAWLATVLAYTGEEGRLTRGTVAVLLVEPAVFTLLVWTNPEHGLVWTDGSVGFVGGYTTYVPEFGLAFWAHQAYSYLLVAAGGVLLVRVLFRRPRVYRLQSTALLCAIAIPMAGNALYVFGFVPAGVDPTAPGYVGSGVVLAVAIFRTDLLSLTPAVRELGREEVLAELDDRVFIVDDRGRLVDANPAAERLLDRAFAEAVGRPLDAELPALAGALSEEPEQTQLGLDLDGSVRYYDVRVSPLSRHRGLVSGRLISLRDVTEQRQREQRLDVLNRVLRHNIRNELNIVRGNVELALADADGTNADRLEAAIGTLDTVLDRSEKVGRLSRLFETDTGEQLDLATHLRSDLSKTASEYPDAEVVLSLPDSVPVAAGPSITAVFDELVRNAIEHNDGERPRVVVAVDDTASDDRYVVVTVSDDGPGIGEQERRVIAEGRETSLDHGSGVGLWLANWVVERNGGTLGIENTDEGAVVSVRLPRPGDTGRSTGRPSGGAAVDTVGEETATESRSSLGGKGTPDGSPD